MNFKKQAQQFLESQLYFFKLIFQEQPKTMLLILSNTIFIALLPPLLIYINQNSINAISGLESNPQLIKLALMLIVTYYTLQLISEFFTTVNKYLFIKISYFVNYILKKLLLEKMINLPLKNLEISSFYDTINLANLAISGNGVKIVKSILAIIASCISLAGIFVILLSIHWSLPVALFISTLPGIILIFIFKFKSYIVQKEISTKERELSFTDLVFVNKNSLKEVKMYQLGCYLIDKWAGLFQYVQQKNLNLAKFELKMKSITLLILNLSSISISILLILQVHKNELSIGSYVALLVAVGTTQSLFSAIGASLGSIFETAIYNNSLLAILHAPSFEENITTNKIRLDTIKKIELKNVSFQYPQANKPTLHNFNLKIHKGEKISIVGHNGSGKTTLAHALLGFYGWDSGEMYINDEPIDKIDKSDYFKKSVAVFQDFTRYRFSIRENIAFGNLETLYKDDVLYSILEKVNLDNKVNYFPNKLDTHLTKEIENGYELSGGEWQKVAIARAFLKDAELVVLDEPTAALDPISEMKIFELFHELSRDKTTITISHRIGPTKLSDRILVMEHGQIVEEGNFEELMCKKGIYYKMYKAQAKHYENSTSQNEEAHAT